ncbi:MAG: hypothetical protein JWQ25_2762 [Daejeonella sp.]|nr:hypothetical protein [Daejeonella sp.]
MIDSRNKISLGNAALIAGIALAGTVVTAPFAELYVLPKLVVPYEAAITVKNIRAHEALFTAAIFAYLFTFTCDIVLAWALYILLKPVNKQLAQLTAWFRLVYSIIALVALNNLVTAFRLLTTTEYSKLFKQDQLQALAMVYLRAFKNHWYFGIILFGIHLLFLGYLVYKSNYIPKIMGALLLITGLGYLLTTLRPYLFPNMHVDFAQYTFYGELIFMLWLLFRGFKIKEPI